MAGINEGVGYLKSIPSVLKILEIILLLVCIGSVGYFLDKLPDDGDLKKEDNLKFFVGAAAVAGIIALLFFLIFLAGLHKKIDSFNWAKTAAVVFVILAILLLVVSALLADTVKYYDDQEACKVWDKLDLKFQCRQLTAGAVRVNRADEKIERDWHWTSISVIFGFTFRTDLLTPDDPNTR